MPKVSIIMSTYNGEQYIAEAIESIISQTYRDWEFIICDDCSTDSTSDILEHYSSVDSRIKIITNTQNLKLAASLNMCLKESRGAYIARMDDDDISDPCRLEKQVQFMDSHREFSVVGCNIEMFNNNNVLGVRKYPEFADLYHQKHLIVQFAHPTVLMRREVLLKLKGYTVAKYTNRGQDFDLWARFFNAGYIGYNIQENLLKYRVADSGYKKDSFENAYNSVIRHIKCYRLLKFPPYMYFKALDPIVTYLVPTWIMAKWHDHKIKA